MTWNNKVVWSEGMFLQPQHFQQHDRYIESLVKSRTAPLLGCCWGFTHIELNSSDEGKIQLTAASGIFPDGTPFDFPTQNEPPLPLNIIADMRDELVVLALPIKQAGKNETLIDSDQEESTARFYVAEIKEVTDSNSNTDNKVPIQIGQLSLKLMRHRDATSAYSILGIAKVRERKANKQLDLYENYIPPMLHSGSDKNLMIHLQNLHAWLHQCGEALVPQILQPGRSDVAATSNFLLLQTINRYEPLMIHLKKNPMLHPERFFSICLSLAGELATFRTSGSHTRRPAIYPDYQHDNLEHCFDELMKDIKSSLDFLPKPDAVAIELRDMGNNYKAALISNSELLRSSRFILAANAQLPSETIRQKIPALVKIGSHEKIQRLVDSYLPGVTIEPLTTVPPQIPFNKGFTYFSLNKGNEEWRIIEQTTRMVIHVEPREFPALELELWAIKED